MRLTNAYRLLLLSTLVLLPLSRLSFAQPETLSLVISADSSGPTINKHIYGHFAEHLGRGIYGGFWIKGDDGEWRLNEPVVEAMRRLDPPNVRWPGGCFADIYHWKDGIGPRNERPTVVNTLWGGVTEDNSFGTHEFMELVRALDADPFVVGNVGSGTVQEMSEWWEYLNHPGKSPMADLRAENGHAEPFNVRFWGVGNESWGCGGNMTPAYYADEYKRFATFLPGYGRVRPFRIATGPDATNPDNLEEWTEVVMRDAGRMIDGLDMHYYTVVGGWGGRTRATEFDESQWIDAFDRAMRLEDYIETVTSIMDRYDPRNRVWLIVGEWGIWHLVEEGTNPGFLYQQSALRDALVASISLDIMNRHAERVRMANIAQTINVLQAMVLTNEENELVLTPTYHVFEMYKVHHDAALIPMTLDEGTYTFGDRTIPAISGSASKDGEGRVHITLTNMDPHAGRTVRASLDGETFSSVSGRVLTAPAMNSHNTFDNPNVVAPKEFTGARLSGGEMTVEMPPMSVVVLELE
ncbi:MAG TPA: alpha-L-arabinofuranosidase C-terminal domain-containing protein [Rhodothermales bacterium]